MKDTCYAVIMGRVKGQQAMAEQAYRYSSDKWSAADAKKHCEAHEGISFEPATNNSQKIDMSKNFHVFVPITKVDKEKRMVYGYASTEALDSHGEIVKKEAIEKALPDYLRFGNIREMHQPSAVGKTKEATIDDKGLYLGAKIVDASAWEKVKEGVYNGFSIGGRKLMQKGKEIQELQLTEVSLVDRPANPEAVFDIYKTEYNGEMSHDEKNGKIFEALNHGEAYEYGVVEVFDKFVIVRCQGGGMFKSYPYEIAEDGTVTLGEPTEVKLTWEEKSAQQVSAMEKVLGYKPWWTKFYQKGNFNQLTNSPMQKQEEVKTPPAAPAEGGAAAPETTPKPSKTPPTAPAAPATDPTVTSPAALSASDNIPTPSGTPVEKVGAKFSKASLAMLQNMSKTLTDLLFSAEAEKSDTTKNLVKVDAGSLQKMLDDHFAKVNGLIDEAVKPLKEQVEKFGKLQQPIKTQAGFVVAKGNEALSGEERTSELKKYEDIKTKLDDFQKIRTSMPMNDFQARHGAEIEAMVTEMRSLKMRLGI